MFSHIIFLVVILVLISFAPIASANDYFLSAPLAFTFGIISYFSLIGFIISQNMFFKKSIQRYRVRILKFVNISFVLFFVLYHFVFVSHRVFLGYSILISLFSLCLYFFGLFIFHLTSAKNLAIKQTPFDFALMQIRFLAPFSIPYLFFTLLIDILPEDDLNAYSTWTFNSIAALFFLITLFFFPAIIQKIWSCQPLSDLDLEKKLEEICQRANYKHAGIKSWTVMNNQLTAGTFGILPSFRYIMLTSKLIKEFTPEQIQAILAHEIGHSKHKHLIIYPFIFFGMVVITSLFSLFFGEAIDTYFWLQYQINQSEIYKITYPLALIVPFILILLIYFRLVFGYFSRLFERQADLYIFKVGIPATTLQSTFDHLGNLTGQSHLNPCWHHHSLQERIDFLQKCDMNKSLITKHDSRVRKSLIIYSIILFSSFVIFISPFYNTISPFKQISRFIDRSSHNISTWINKGE